MEIYPSIDNHVINTPIIAFDKIDGSNIRAEWNRKSGFMKYGTRKRLLDPSEKPFGEAISLIEENYADDLDRIFRKERLERATAFFEFGGENSFAGFHEDEPHEVTLFDLHIYKQGIIPPKEFLKLFENKVKTAPVLYRGIANQNFIESVKESTLKGMTFEGVVCKGGWDHRRQLINFKVKSHAWLGKLKGKYGNNPVLLKQLS